VVLAARAGGRQTFGRYPWYAAAYIGGSESNRGYLSQRFAGDSSAYGSVELRLRVADSVPVVPGRMWVFGLADAGRVWLEGEDSDEWHPSFGGGVVFEVAATPIAFWTGIAKARDEDGVRFYFQSGFGF
jgi:outer membrane protein assembly factor BamA